MNISKTIFSKMQTTYRLFGKRLKPLQKGLNSYPVGSLLWDLALLSAAPNYIQLKHTRAELRHGLFRLQCKLLRKCICDVITCAQRLGN